MSVDFWAEKLKDNLNENDFIEKDCWDLIKDDDNGLYDLLPKDISDFIIHKNDKHWWQFCVDTVGFFVGGDPVYQDSKKDIDKLKDKLNIFIKENSEYEYVYKKSYYIDENNKPHYKTYSNKEVRMFIKYINAVADNGYVLWCSY